MTKTKTKEKYSVTESVTIFDFLNDITYHRKFILNEDNEHIYSKYMILRWLSLKKEYVPLVSCLNKYQGILDNYEFHRFAISLVGSKVKFMVSKGDSPFFKPPFKDVADELELIITFFKVSTREAYQYYVNLSDKDQRKLIKNLKFFYGLKEKK